MKLFFLLIPFLCFASDQSTLIKELRDFLKVSKPNRIVGSIGHLKSREYIKKYLLDLGERLEIQSFNPDIDVAKNFYQGDFDKNIKNKYANNSSMYINWNNFTQYIKTELDKFKDIKGENLIWIKKSKIPSNDWLILMAHYDSISHSKDNFKILYDETGPGADYNGTGVTSALRIAKSLKNIKLKKNLLVLFPDYHIFGYLGSYHFNKNISEFIPKDAKISVFNLEMLGHDTEAFDKTKKTFNYKLYTRKDNPQDKELVNILLKYNDTCKSKMYFDLLENNFESSDHVRFWEKNIGAIAFSQNWEVDFNINAYQTSSDIVETINQSSFYEAHKYIMCIALKHLTH